MLMDLNDFGGNCNSYLVESLFKHRTNDYVDKKSSLVQINHPNVEYEIHTEKHGTWNVFKGLLMDGRSSSISEEVNLKNRELNIGIINVS